MWVTLGILISAAIVAMLAVAMFIVGLPGWFCGGLLALAAWTVWERLDDVPPPPPVQPEECDLCLGTGRVLMPWPGAQEGAHFVPCPACCEWEDVA